MAQNCKILIQVTQTLSGENKDIFHNQLHRLTMLSDDQRPNLKYIIYNTSLLYIRYLVKNNI